MIDFSEGSENLVEFALKLASKTNGKLVFIHQIAGMVPALADQSARTQIHNSEIEEAIEKIKYLTKNSFYDRESFIASPKSITSIIDDLKSNQYTDWVIGGLKTNSLFKKLVFGSKLVRILEYSNLITVAIPIDKQMLIPEKLFIAVTTKYPLNEIQLSTMLSGLKSSLKEILFFTILEDEEDDIQIKNYFLELQKTYGEYKPSATILKSNNFLIEAKRIVHNSENSFLVIQEGSRTLLDEIFRKYQTNEIIHMGIIPLIVLPNE
jgi:nucleotide-binding universal stress UspA family protein